MFFLRLPLGHERHELLSLVPSLTQRLFFFTPIVTTDLRRLIYVDKINNMYITYIQKKNTKCLFYLTCTETCTTTECDIKKNVENAGHGLWLYDIKGIYIFDASEASVAIYKGN